MGKLKNANVVSVQPSYFKMAVSEVDGSSWWTVIANHTVKRGKRKVRTKTTKQIFAIDEMKAMVIFYEQYALKKKG